MYINKGIEQREISHLLKFNKGKLKMMLIRRLLYVCYFTYFTVTHLVLTMTCV